MNAPHPRQLRLAALTRHFVQIRESRFAADKLSIGLVVVALVLNALALIAVAARVRPTGVLVPVHFSSLNNGFDTLGPWYFPFEIVIFALLTTLVNTYFAYTSYLRSRLASFFLLTGTIVVAVFAFIVANAFSVVAPQ